MIKRLLKSFTLNPKKLFLIDGLGAVLSAFLLGIVLVKFESIIGIPPSTLYFLAVFPLLFATYDFYCYRKKHNNLKFFLEGIAVANLLYCCFSVGVTLYHLKTITYLGWIYILAETLIILILLSFEFMIAKQLAKN
ncbi:hypothetical protein [Tenacibaculum discolor]|uniref:hypothetical protein n=1 Tax=Tenacibaculum discolor TaxID=361581 RepID=UPI003F79FEE1